MNESLDPVAADYYDNNPREVVIDKLAAMSAEVKRLRPFEDNAREYTVTIGKLRDQIAAVEQRAAAAEAQAQTLREALEFVAQAQPNAIKVVRDNGFVFSRAPGKVAEATDDGERWEHLAFSFYTDLASLSNLAEQALAEEGGEA